ncbi:hypothetical protein ACFL60_01430 [Candidatus Omnitrophota bacterium]
MNFFITKLWTDEEIGGRLYLQACKLDVNGFLSNSEKDDFFDKLFAVMHKITAMKYHLDNYQIIEKKIYSIARQKFKKDSKQSIEAFELIFELESFLFQLKSSLDMLVKLLIPIIGKGIVGTQTFGDKGNKVIKGLEKLKSKKDVNVKAINDLITLIRDDKDSWLENVINIRDNLNHVKGLRNYEFIPVKLPNGDIIPQKPEFLEIQTVPFMKLVYSNNLEFSQDFMSFSLALRLPPGLFLIEADSTKCQEEFNHKAARFIKYVWGANFQTSG